MDYSFVSKAKLAFHNAAAKAERVLTEFKADLKVDLARVNGPISNTITKDQGSNLASYKQAHKGFLCDDPPHQPSGARSEQMPNIRWSPPNGCTWFAGPVKLTPLPQKLANDGGNKSERFPWTIEAESEKCHEDELRHRILELSKFPEEFLLNPLEEDCSIDMASETEVASTILEYDEDLRNLRFSYVPKKMEEQEFWKRYFGAVNRIKQNFLNTQDRRNSEAILKDSQERDDASGLMEIESPKKDPMEEEEYARALSAPTILSSKQLRRLAAAIESRKSVQKMKDLENSGKGEKDYSQGPDWSSFVSGLSAVKKFSHRDRNKIDACISSLFKADKQCKAAGILADTLSPHLMPKFSEEINGAPPGSFVAQLAEIMASFETPKTMAECWAKVLLELRHRWAEGKPIPKMPVDASPDFRFCILYQQLQFINCCIARKKRHAAAVASLHALTTADIVSKSNKSSPETPSRVGLLYARGHDRTMVLRRGADCPAGGLRMLETGDLIYSPVTQEGPVLTELMVKEREELVLRTGSVGAGCCHLLSDMQAFKAANPGCILEDFVRWYSPQDWKQEPVLRSVTQLDAPDIKDGESRGSLSLRMKSQGNLWQELWASAKPVPAALQAPLFDADLQVEQTLDELEEVRPAVLSEQLFRVALGVGFVVAELSPAAKNLAFASQLAECKEYILSICCTQMDAEQFEQLSQVYEHMEKGFIASLDDCQEAKVPSSVEGSDSEPVAGGVSEKGGKNFSNYIVGLDRHIFRRLPPTECHHHNNENMKPAGPNILSRIFEAKSSFFERKSPRGTSLEEGVIAKLPDSEWTLV